MPKKFTPLRLATHDFSRSLRVWRTLTPPKDIFYSLVHERTKSLRAALRSLTFGLGGALWLSSSHTTLALTVGSFDIRIPSTYVILAVTAFIFNAVTSLLSFFVLNEFLRVFSHKVLRFDNPSALTVPLDGGNAWILGTLLQFRFLSSGRAHCLFGYLALPVLIIPVLGIFLLMYSAVFSSGYSIMLRDGLLSFNGLIISTGWALAAYPLLHIIALFVPFKFQKNVNFIRWRFLSPLYRRQGLLPPRLPFWLPPEKP